MENERGKAKLKFWLQPLPAVMLDLSFPFFKMDVIVYAEGGI